MHQIEKENENDIKDEVNNERNSLFLNKQPCRVCGRPTASKKLIGWIIVYICSHHTDHEILDILNNPDCR